MEYIIALVKAIVELISHYDVPEDVLAAFNAVIDYIETKNA